MKKNIIKYTLGYFIILWIFFSSTFAATTERWQKIYEQLKDDWWTNDEIRYVLEDLWYNANEYIWSSRRSNSNNWGTTQLWREILENLRRKWWTDKEIKDAIEDMGYDSSAYFPSNSTSYNSPSYNSPSYNSPSYSYDSSTYVSRSCKTYSIEYVNSLNVYTSPNLKKREYFINTDYFKRYIDSKNIPNAECTQNSIRLTPYNDTSADRNRFVAPNWKVYFITQQDWYYTSSELNAGKKFWNVDELKRYIGRNNPLANI